jgi:DegV family protein with EDD domain
MIKISTDSTSDLTPALLDKFAISLVPLEIIVDDQAYIDGIDIQPADIFHYAAAGKTCQTAAVNVFTYQRHFQELASQYEAVIHISLGSLFSSSYQNALLAARDFPNVYVVDSANLSSGSGLLVYEAALMGQQGLPAEEIVEKLKTLVPKIETSFVIDNLDYLQRGGRCSALQNQGAKLLRLKPCIEVRDGRMVVGKKYRGSFTRALEKYVEDRLKDRKDIDCSRIFITHAMCAPEVVSLVRDLTQEYANFAEVIVADAGATISCHCGPNTLGVLFMRK